MEKFKIALGIFIVLCWATMTFGCITLGNGADGMATDSIARVSYGGWIWKTWRVELTNDHPTADNPMRYGVENDQALITQLQNYAASGQRVKLYYHSKIVVFDWEYSDAEVIYKVELANVTR